MPTVWAPCPENNITALLIEAHAKLHDAMSDSKKIQNSRQFFLAFHHISRFLSVATN
jgi:hypothetical protein